MAARTVRIVAIAFTLAAASLGCSRQKAPPPRPEPEANPTVFPLAETNIVVAASALPDPRKSQIVRADFNFDKRDDIAISEQDAAGRSIVSIYLQMASDQVARRYVRAGVIRQSGDYSISALMSAGGKDRSDLLVVFHFADGRKELVHFRSDGKEFREVMRKALSTTPAPTAPPK